VRIIRSKGVGVYFCSQFPDDVPDEILGQLGNRVQHALRAFTPRDQKAVKAAAETMRANPKFSTETAITELAVGEGLISFLDEKGRPSIVERAYVLPPASRIGPITPEERKAVIAASPVAGVYDKDVDRESAYEKLKSRAASTAPAPGGTTPGASPQAGGGMMGGLKDILLGTTGPRGGHREGMLEAMAKSAGRTATTAVTGALVRGVLGSLLGGGKRR